ERTAHSRRFVLTPRGSPPGTGRLRRVGDTSVPSPTFDAKDPSAAQRDRERSCDHTVEHRCDTCLVLGVETPARLDLRAELVDARGSLHVRVSFEDKGVETLS